MYDMTSTLVKTLKKNNERQDAQIQKLQTYAEESATLASDRNAKCQVAVDVLKFVRSQLNTLTEKLPPDDESIKALTFKLDDFLQSAPSRKFSNRKHPKVEESEEVTSHNESSAGETSKDGRAHSAEKKEVIEQFEPGVYVTLIQLSNGTKIFKRVRFRYMALGFS
ncbi:putative brevis radix (BRX) domain-containing protein [Helianthus annuus]|nr:putative brevis radix (BRX) domain-containing protein [Helianthus annuus]